MEIKTKSASRNSFKVTDIAITSDGLQAKVFGVEMRPQHVKASLIHFTSQEWETAIYVLSLHAIYEASLLNGEMPLILEEHLLAWDIHLFPRDSSQWITTCTCKEFGRCKHAAEVVDIAEQLFKNNPLVIFELRGLPTQQLFNKIRNARFNLLSADFIERTALPLTSESPEDAYQMPLNIGHFLDNNPAFWKREISLDELLGAIYDEVSKKAAAIRTTCRKTDGEEQ